MSRFPIFAWSAICLLLILSTSFAAPAKQSLCILPFQNLTKLKSYNWMRLTWRTILQKKINEKSAAHFTIISCSQPNMFKISTSDQAMAQYAQKNGASFVLYGDYGFSDGQLTVWTKLFYAQQGSDVFFEKKRVFADPRIFYVGAKTTSRLNKLLAKAAAGAELTPVKKSSPPVKTPGQFYTKTKSKKLAAFKAQLGNSSPSSTKQAASQTGQPDDSKSSAYQKSTKSKQPGIKQPSQPAQPGSSSTDELPNDGLVSSGLTKKPQGTFGTSSGPSGVATTFDPALSPYKIPRKIHGQVVKVLIDYDGDGSPDQLLYHDKQGLLYTGEHYVLENILAWAVHFKGNKPWLVERYLDRPGQRNKVEHRVELLDKGKSTVYLKKNHLNQFRFHFENNEMLYWEIDEQGDGVFEIKKYSPEGVPQ